MAHRAVRPRPSSRRARTGAGARAHDARSGGAVMRTNDWAAAAALLTLLVLAGCTRRVEPDAYGNVEATEVVVGAEASGRLVTLSAVEGGAVAAGAVVGAIDAAQLGFERDQLVAQQQAARSRGNEV